MTRKKLCQNEEPCLLFGGSLVLKNPTSTKQLFSENVVGLKLSRGGCNTSNLLHHFSHKHVLEYQECMKLRSAPSTSAGNTRRDYNRDYKLYHYPLSDMVPLYTVEKDGFRRMIKTLDPRYVIPSRKYFSQTAIPNLYQQHRAKLEVDLATIPHFAATTDTWFSRSMEPYLSLTVHFISDDWVLRSHCLQTSYFPDDHIGKLLATGLQDALDCWGLSMQKLVAITTDSGANIKKAIKLNNWTRLQCFGHRLHLAIGKQ